VHITLYTRPGCHLCEEALALLRQAARGGSVEIIAVNVDERPELAARYGERVPVARIGERELAWPFTLWQARAALAATRPEAGP
jgi:glutaredoxin